MIVKSFTWELDPYANNESNLIKGERQTLTAVNGGDYRFFIPKGSPFYTKDAVLKHVATGDLLTLGVDWQPAFHFELVSKRTYMPVYGGVCITNAAYDGTFEFEYRTLGGEFTLDTQSLLTLLSNVTTDPRTTTWEKITDVPWYFTPIQHLFDVKDTVGASELEAKLHLIADKIQAAADQIYPGVIAHANNFENPHGVTKAQVNLGNVNNFGIATVAEAAAGIRNDRYMTPYLTSVMVAALNQETVAGHVADKDNPHGVTAAQVGLGSVVNYGVATDAQAIDNTNDVTYVTPRKVYLGVMHWVGNALATHIGRTDNPHNTTAAQVGLGSVQNYGIATEANAQSGNGNDAYMTPYLTKVAIAAQAGASGVQAHIDNTANPHNTTATQVGLGSVQNYGIAAQADAEAGTSNLLYMTPLRTAQAIAKLALIPLGTHTGRTDNPHNTTAAQVGLGSVQNYGIASQADLDDGSSNVLYVTVAGVTSMISKTVGALLATHKADRNNPHVVTKDQVGLSAVHNYGVGETTDYDAGTSDTLYATIWGVSRMIAKLGGETITGHVANKENPHAVTALQVGLGNVQNYAIANAAQLEAGTSNVAYVTPAGVYTMIMKFVGTAMADHISDKTNPHEVTAAQIGLGSVQNYGVATENDLDAGTATNLYVTVAGVAHMIANSVSSALTTHLGNKSNPHEVTAAQIGLGSVQNYGVAAEADIDTGTATNLYVTVAGLVHAIQQRAVSLIEAHTNRSDNPHNTTAAQLGLGSVANYAIATQAEAIAGTSNERYVTPSGLSAHVSSVLATQLAAQFTSLAIPVAVTADIGADNGRSYRFMAAAALTLPNISAGRVRVIVDHSVDPAAVICSVAVSDGNTIDSYSGVDQVVRLSETGREYIFDCIESAWRVS